MHPPTRRALGLSLVAALGGCDITIKPRMVSETLSADMAAFLEREGLQVRGVDCPPREAKKGDTFTCTAQVDATTWVPIDAVQLDDVGTVSFEPGEGVTSLTGISSAAEKMLHARAPDGPEVEVDCGTELIVHRPGATFPCTATAGPFEAKLVVTLRSRSEFELEVLPGAGPLQP